ncbi:hypothetical protein GCM10010464_28790 [Pseudonocardia yunnanensis]
MRERHSGDCRNLGFTTYTGTVTAADDWGSRKITFSVFAAAHRREDTMSVPRAIHQSLQVPVAGVLLEADLGVPRESTRGAALFAHGSGSGRYSSRNRHVADELNRSGFVTVLAGWAADSPRTGLGVGPVRSQLRRRGRAHRRREPAEHLPIVSRCGRPDLAETGSSATSGRSPAVKTMADATRNPVPRAIRADLGVRLARRTTTTRGWKGHGSQIEPEGV